MLSKKLHIFNFLKSEVYCFGEAKVRQEEYARIFTCTIGTFPFRYWVCLYTIRNLVIAIGNLLRRNVRRKQLPGKGACFQWAIGLLSLRLV